MWNLQDGRLVNSAVQTSQENGCSPVCFPLRILKDDLFENAAPQTSKENGSSQVWVRMLHFKYNSSENTDQQTLHSIIFSHVCSHVTFQMGISGKC